MHVYNQDFSLVYNVLGEFLMSKFRSSGELNDQVLFSLQSCCYNSYITSFFALGLVSVLGVVLALAAGLIFNSNRKTAISLALLWAFANAWGLYAGYAQIAEVIVNPTNRQAQYLAGLWQAMPFQFVFNSIVAFIIACLGYGMTRPAKEQFK